MRGAEVGIVERIPTRWKKFGLIVLDEVGYVPLAAIGAEFLFQDAPSWRNYPRCRYPAMFDRCGKPEEFQCHS